MPNSISYLSITIQNSLELKTRWMQGNSNTHLDLLGAKKIYIPPPLAYKNNGYNVHKKVRHEQLFIPYELIDACSLFSEPE